MKKFQISNFKFQIASLRFSLLKGAGFTLIETLIVMLVLVTIGSIILSIFIIALTGASKSRNQQIVRENGNYAISQISRLMQYARAFNYVDTTSKSNPDIPTGFEVYSCQADPSVHYRSVSMNTFDGTNVLFTCTTVAINGVEYQTLASPSASVSPADASLFNLEKVRLEPNSCYFTCTQSASGPPTIGIYFTLSPKNGGITPVNFQTSVVPRNF